MMARPKLFIFYRQPKLFISYRQEISRESAGSLYKRLSHEYGKTNIFFDQEPNGDENDWRERMQKEVLRCDVFLCIIEGEWLSLTRNEIRRLEQPLDPVRREVEAALEEEKAVIPILVNGVAMPPEAELPKGIQWLAYRVGLPYSTRESEAAQLQAIVRRINGEYERSVRIFKLKRLFKFAVLFAAVFGVSTAYLLHRSSQSESLDGVYAGLERHDAKAFHGATKEKDKMMVSRSFLRGDYETITDHPSLLAGTVDRLDYLSFTGYYFVHNSEQDILSALKKPIQIRLLVMDERGENKERYRQACAAQGYEEE
jgi:hypothetical protein